MREPSTTSTEPTTAAQGGQGGQKSRGRRLGGSPLLWDGVLALLTIVPTLVFTALFFPGRANVDIANQYAQATGDIPVSDWHPPVMSAVWRVLIDLTGEPGSLFILQVALLALACWGIGVLIHRLGASRWVPLAGPAIMITPWVVSQMTTMWKDTQMAVAMLLAVVLLIITRFAPKTWLLWIPAIVLLVYAFGLRKNAIFAIVPIAVYLGYLVITQLRGSRRLSKLLTRTGPMTAVASVLVLVVLGLGVKATDMAIASQTDVKPTGQISQIFLDDVMFSVPGGELQDSDAPAELKDKIGTARDKCLEMGEIWDAYWNCYGRGETGKPFSPIAYQDELKDLWLNEVITHPIRYAKYRAAVFSYYFFTSAVEYWPAEWHGEAQAVGLKDGSVQADYIVKPYVEDFALGTFPMLFKPWFWTLLAVVALGLAYRGRARSSDAVASFGARDRATSAAADAESVGAADNAGGRTRSLWPEVTMLATSALCYIFGYFPIVPANHFRYTFWPALAVTVATVLVLAMWRSGRRHRSTTTVGEGPVRAGRSPATPPTRASSESET